MSPQHEQTVAQAAQFLNVSCSFVVKEIEEGRLPAHGAGVHLRILGETLMTYKAAMQASQHEALHRLAESAQELGGY